MSAGQALRRQTLGSIADDLDATDPRTRAAFRPPSNVSATSEGVTTAVRPQPSSTDGLIAWEDPPRRRGGGLGPSEPPAWLVELLANPNRWGLIAQTAKSSAYGRGWRKRYPKLQVVSRRREDGKGFLIYGRIRP